MNRASQGNSGGKTSSFDARALLAAEPQELTDGEVIDGVLSLAAHVGQAQAALARLAATFDTRALATIDGARSTAGWLAARTELPRTTAAALVLTGRGLRRCPVVDAAAREGRLGVAKVQMLLAARVDLEDLFAEHEAVIVAEVAPLTVAQAAVVIKDWRRFGFQGEVGVMVASRSQLGLPA